MKFIHAADLHLDSPLRGLERYEGAPAEVIRGATRRALENLVELALREEVAFVVIAGDVYDGDWQDYNTGLFFVAQMRRLTSAGIHVFLIRGNHDAASQMSRQLRLPEGVHLFDHRKVTTVQLKDLGVAVHGQSFGNRAVPENLVPDYPKAVGGCFNIGLLHTSADGRPGHEPYAPCKVADLVAKGYDYWALGHVHEREVLHETPWVVFSGIVQGRHARETGAKGCTLITVDDGEVTRVEACELDVVRWSVLSVDADGAESLTELLDRVREALADAIAAADGRLVAARVQISGATEMHQALLGEQESFVGECRNLANEFGGEVWLEKVKVQTRPMTPLEDLARQGDAVGELLLFLRSAGEDDALLEQSVAGLKGLSGKVDRLNFDVAWARAELPEVERLLAVRLADRGEEGAA